MAFVEAVPVLFGFLLVVFLQGILTFVCLGWPEDRLMGVEMMPVDGGDERREVVSGSRRENSHLSTPWENCREGLAN